MFFYLSFFRTDTPSAALIFRLASCRFPEELCTWIWYEVNMLQISLMLFE